MRLLPLYREFYGCSRLTNINIPQSVTAIRHSSFLLVNLENLTEAVRDRILEIQDATPPRQNVNAAVAMNIHRRANKFIANFKDT